MIKIRGTENGVAWFNLNFDAFTFNGGEEHIRIGYLGHIKEAHIMASIKSSKEVMQLFLLTDALRRKGAKRLTLDLPYVPYARQDRACAEGDAFSLKVFAKLLNSLNFDEVTIVDPHSDVTPALIENCKVVDMLQIVDKFMGHLAADFIPVCPDAGATKKVFKICQYLNKDMIRADKVRNPATGEITETVIVSKVNFKDQKVMIFDDICDGGRTFIELAKVLKKMGASEVHLFVTHGIFSHGYGVLQEGGIDKVITTDSLNPVVKPEYVKIIPLDILL